MTNPIESAGLGAIGDVYVNVSSRVKEDDARAAVKDIDTLSNKEFNRLGTENGQQWSNTFATEVKNALGSDITGKPTYKAGSVSAMLKNNVETSVKDALRDGTTIVDDVVMTEAGKKQGGLFSAGFGTTVKDALKTTFSAIGDFLSPLFDFQNSPVLNQLKSLQGSLSGVGDAAGPIGAFVQGAFQVSAMATMVSYIVAAVDGLQGVVALLSIIPGLFSAAVGQFVTLFVVFHNLTTVVGQVFQAQNVTQLDAALKGVNTTVANVLRQLYDWKTALSDISKVAQPAFFGQIGSKQLTDVLNNIKPALTTGIVEIAKAWGSIWSDILNVLADPRFAKLIDIISNSTTTFLAGFGPAIANLISGFTDLATSMAPLMDWFGSGVNKAITAFGDALSNLGKNPDWQKFVEDSKTKLPELVDLLASAGKLILVLIGEFNQADEWFKKSFGVDFIQFMTQVTQVFITVTQALGEPAFQGALIALAALVFTFLGLMTAIEFVFAATDGLIQGTYALIKGLGDLIGNTIYDFSQWIQDRVHDVQKFFDDQIADLRKRIQNYPQMLKDGLVELPTVFMNEFEKIYQVFYDAGKNMMARLIQGIKDSALGLGTAIADALEYAVNQLKGHSPVKEGPLSGDGDPYLSGKNIIDRLVLGINESKPKVGQAVSNVASTVVFAPGAITNNYNNANPANAAQHAAIMNGQFVDTVGRDMRLAVRALS